MSTNFLRFDENAQNILNDADYSSSTQRQNGVVPGIAQSALHNKLFFQVSTMVAAIAEIMSDAGETISDSSYSNLKTSLIDIFIQTITPSPFLVIGYPPEYNNAASIILPEGISATDSTNTVLLEAASDLTVSLAVSGAANGLDTGSEAGDTWYYVYLIGDSNGVNPVAGLFSVTNESVSGTITLPTGYDLKSQLPLAVRNDGSSDIVPFIMHFLSSKAALVHYTVQFSETTGTVTPGTTNVLAAGTAGTWASIDCSDFVPPIAKEAIFHTVANSSGAYGQIRDTTYGTITPIGGAVQGPSRMNCTVSASQTVEYQRDAGTGTFYVDIVGFYAEVAA